MVAGDLDLGRERGWCFGGERGKGCENEGCELWGCRGGLIDRGGVGMGTVF